jgi:hypothetical protein
MSPPRATGQETVASLTRRLDQADSNLDTHEAVCAERYKALEDSNADLKKQLDAINTTLKAISDAQIATAAVRQALANDRPKWWHQLLGGAVIALIGWMGATIWNMNNARVDAALLRPMPSAAPPASN